MQRGALFILRFLPKNAISSLVGWFVQVKWPFQPSLMKWFVAKYRLNLDEAEKPLEAYATLGDLFTRRIKMRMRPLGAEPVHCADARLTMRGKIERGQVFQAKGQPYTLGEFLGVPMGSEWHRRYEGGTFFTYYLCPTDYHRVHSPVSGRIRHLKVVQGTLWPVHDLSVALIPRLFAVNERMWVEIETEKGFVLVCMVGATNVGKMTASFDPEIRTNRMQQTPHDQLEKLYQPPIPVKAGDELGIFHMGSTAVIFFSPHYSFSFAKAEPQDLSVKVRASLAAEGL